MSSRALDGLFMGSLWALINSFMRFILVKCVKTLLNPC